MQGVGVAEQVRRGWEQHPQLVDLMNVMLERLPLRRVSNAICKVLGSHLRGGGRLGSVKMSEHSAP
jgi:hypothetical protein